MGRRDEAHVRHGRAVVALRYFIFSIFLRIAPELHYLNLQMNGGKLAAMKHTIREDGPQTVAAFLTMALPMRNIGEF